MTLDFDGGAKVMFRLGPDLVTWPLDLGSQKLRKKMCYWILTRYAENGGAARRRFEDILEK